MSDTNKLRKKPTKGVVVPSRYKQAAQSSKQGSSREKSPQSRATSPQHSEKNMLTSTMNSASSVQKRCVFPAIDASTIADEKGFLTVPSNAADSTRLCSVKKKTKGQTSKGSIHSPRKAPVDSNSANTLTQAELNCLYAEYLQAKLLESQAKEALQKRSADISEKIYQIWTLMQDLMVKNAIVYQDLQVVSGLNKLHAHLQKQEEMLLPVLEMIPVFENQYESIAKAVDTVRHKLEVKSASLPENDSDEVINLLMKISDLIINIKDMHNSDKIILAAEGSEIFLQKAEKVSAEIKSAGTLLSEANDSLLNESTLKLAKLEH